MRKHCFTLPELTLVVLTGAILCSLVSGSTGSARLTGKDAVCLNNLKRQGEGIAKYAADNRGVQPVNQGSAGSESGFRKVYASQIAKYVEPEYLSRFAFRKPISDKPTIFQCPADEYNKNWWYPMSYGTVRFNLYPQISGEEKFLVTYDKIKNPAQLFAVLDANHAVPLHPAGTNGILPPWYLDPRTNKYVARAVFVKDLSGDGIKESYSGAKDKNSVWYFNGASPRHNMSVNALFVDGHAAANTESEFVKDIHWKVIKL